VERVVEIDNERQREREREGEKKGDEAPLIGVFVTSWSP
jgi:hypothetical protein